MTKPNYPDKKVLSEIKYTELENAGVMITAFDFDDKTIFIHRLLACELQPDYMTTDRLYEILEQRLKSSDVTNYHGCLGDFVVGFVMTRVRGKK